MFCGLLFCFSATAEEAVKEVEKPEKTAEKMLNPKIMAMADNTWLKMSPERNAKGRQYCGPCYGGGKLFYFGGGHFSWPYNDVELYDLATDAWEQVTKPEVPPECEERFRNPKTATSGEVVRDCSKIAAERASPSGAPYMGGHTYQYTSWDPVRERFFLPYRQCGTWEFDPAARKWENILNIFEEPRPKTPHNLGGGLMGGIHSTFVPQLGKPVAVITQRSRGIHVFDYEAKAWKLHKPLPKALTSMELYSTYVDEWKAHLFSLNKWKETTGAFMKVDLAAGTATAIESPKDMVQCHAVSYDSANKVVMVMPRVDIPESRTDTVAVWALDVKTLKWTEMKPEGTPKGNNIAMWAPLWYDAAHNAHIFLNNVGRGATFQGGKTETWAYRYKRAEEKKEGDE